MKTVVILVAFDGTNYCGMQNQKSAPSVQHELEQAFLLTCGDQAQVIAAGRTDAGVHARGMVAHVRVSDEWPVTEDAIKRAINSRLPRDIRVKGAQLRSDDIFHARFDASAREYSYTLITDQDPLTRLFSWQPRYRFDDEILVSTASTFLGTHNFTTFSKVNDEVKSYICNVDVCEWQRVDSHTRRLRIRANRFVYGMVRCLVGAMVEVARGKRSVEQLESALLAEDRKYSSPLAPSSGLVFERAYYPEGLHVHFV